MNRPLTFFLEQRYPYLVTPDPDGGFFLAYPDLPRCMTQVADERDIPRAADEIRTLWLESAYANGVDIPLPRTEAAYSGKFVVRVPRSLHQRLAKSAEQEGISLNQYVVSLLSMQDAIQRMDRRFDDLEQMLGEKPSRHVA